MMKTKRLHPMQVFLELPSSQSFAVRSLFQKVFWVGEMRQSKIKFGSILRVLIVLICNPVLYSTDATYKGTLHNVNFFFDEESSDRVAPLAATLTNFADLFVGPPPTRLEDLTDFAGKNKLSICVWQREDQAEDQSRTGMPTITLLRQEIFSRGKPSIHLLLWGDPLSELFMPLKVIPQSDPKIDALRVVEACIKSYIVPHTFQTSF